jgi:hypothetical protein
MRYYCSVTCEQNLQKPDGTAARYEESGHAPTAGRLQPSKHVTDVSYDCFHGNEISNLKKNC